MALLGVARFMDIGPWRGWEIVNDGATSSLGPLASPVGQVAIAILDGILTVSRGEQRLLVTNVRGPISHICFGESEISFTLPPITVEDAFLHFPGIGPKRVRHVVLDGRPAAHAPRDAGISIVDLRCAPTQRHVELSFTSAQYSYGRRE